MQLFTRARKKLEESTETTVPALPVGTRVLAQLAKVARWAHVLPPRIETGTEATTASDAPVKPAPKKRASKKAAAAPKKAAATTKKAAKPAARKAPKAVAKGARRSTKHAAARHAADA